MSSYLIWGIGLGNSMAVPVMKWIGERINEINQQT